jgi:hypothetical protein
MISSPLTWPAEAMCVCGAMGYSGFVLLGFGTLGSAGGASKRGLAEGCSRHR